jgi:6-phosphofructokinase 2
MSTGTMTDIVTLTINPAVDLATSVARIEPTHKLRCRTVLRDPGGGGINVARVARRLGGDVAAIYPAGPSIGRLLRRLVDEQGITSIAVDIAEETREDFTALDERSGEQYRFVLPGPRLSEAEWRACLDALAKCEPAPHYVVASGSLPPNVPVDFYRQAAQLAAEMNARFVLDTSGPALRPALDCRLFLLKPNLRELRELTQLPLDDRAEQVDACRKLITDYRLELVALTLAEQGALLVTREQAWQARAPKVKLVSAVGAGDSFLGAMVWALSSGLHSPDAFRYGVAAGTAALLTPGTELCHPDDVNRLLADVSVEQL